VDVHEVIEMERSTWRALGTSAEVAAAHWEEVLAEQVLVLLPGPMVIDDRDAVIASAQGEPWSTWELFDERVLELGPDVAVVGYRATATRGGATYAALFSSTWVRRDGRWRLAVHQQTPL